MPKARDVVMPFVPPKRRKRPEVPSVKLRSLTLLRPPMKVIWLSFQKRLMLNAGHACQIALAVDNLEFVDHVDGQVFRSHFGVVAEKFLAVDEYLGHFLAVSRDFAL